MYAVYKMRADERTSSFLETLKQLFEGREIEIAVCEAQAGAGGAGSAARSTPDCR